jgi:hypothetical protein
VDIVADAGFIGYDLHRLVTSGRKDLGENLAALGADVVGAIVPGVTGLGVGVRATSVAAKSSANAARLAEHLRQLGKYGKGGYRQLEGGLIRYYGELVQATKTGEMIGRRLVRE